MPRRDSHASSHASTGAAEAARAALGDDALLDRRVRDLCDAVGAFIDYWGFRAIHGRVWVLLAIRSEPMSQAEIAAFLQVSRALVSTAMSELQGYRLVRPTHEHRNAPYTATIDVWPTITDVLRSREWMLLESSRLALEATVDEISMREREGQSHPYRLKRLRILLAMTEMAQALLKVLLSLGGARTPRGLGRWISKAFAVTRSLRADSSAGARSAPPADG
ncbi:MAG: hypothetical protein JRH20_06670 [Deltaproteobacteria bacterium]|nr:hypothetical protein [Deltaproteobacteria bacterium]